MFFLILISKLFLVLKVAIAFIRSSSRPPDLSDSSLLKNFFSFLVDVKNDQIKIDLPEPNFSGSQAYSQQMVGRLLSFRV